MTSAVGTPVEATKHLDQKAIGIVVEKGGFGNSGHIAQSEVEVDADKSWISVKKRLLDSPEYTRVKALEKKAELFMRSRCLPSYFKAGVYLVPLSMLDETVEYLDSIIAQWEEAVRDFLAAYPQRVAEAKLRLRGNHRAADYPSVAKLASRFYFNYHFMSFDVPSTLKEMSAAIYRQEVRKKAAIVDEMIERVRAGVRLEAKKLVDELYGKLRAYNNGDQKIVQESSLNTVRSFIDAFRQRNTVAEDEELQRIVRSMESVLTSYDSEDIRSSESIAGYIQKKFGDISAALDGLIVEAPKRKISWED